MQEDWARVTACGTFYFPQHLLSVCSLWLRSGYGKVASRHCLCLYFGIISSILTLTGSEGPCSEAKRSLLMHRLLAG